MPTPFLLGKHHNDCEFALKGLSVRAINSHPSQFPSLHGGKAYALSTASVLTVRAHPKSSGCLGMETKGQRS